MISSRIHEPFYKKMVQGGRRCPEFWHQITFPDGTVSGGSDLSDFRFENIQPVLPNLTGKTVLDVGAWDGYFSFKAEQLGAARVLAIDHFCWDGPGWGTKKNFDFAVSKFNSKVESMRIDVPEINPDTVGKWDVVLMLGLLYHLPSLLTSFVNIAECANEWIVLETLEDLSIDQTIPLFKFFPFAECYGDETNWFVPNPLAIREMCRYANFAIEYEKHYCSEALYPRGIYVAKRTKPLLLL